MLGIAISIFSLLVGTAFLLLGIGLQGTLLGLRAVEEQFSAGVIGYVMSSYFIGFAIGTYLCPSLIRRVGHIRAYTAMAAVASSMAIAYVMLINPFAWALFRIITGICAVGLFMIIESWINSLAPNHLRGQFFSSYMTISFLALAGAQYFLFIGEVTGFTLFAIISILISTSLIPIALTRIEQPQLVETPRIHIFSVYHDSPLGVVGTLTTGIVMGAFLTMMPVYSAQTGLDTNSIAWLMSITILGGATLQWPIGKISDHIDRRFILGISAFSAALLALAGLIFSSLSTIILYFIYFCYGGFAFSLYSLSAAHVNDRLNPEQALDASQTLLQLYGIGAVLGPLMAGLAMQQMGNHALPLMFAVALLLLTGFTVWRIFQGEAPPAEECEEFIPLGRTSTVVMEMDPRVDHITDDQNPGSHTEKNINQLHQ